jgi:DNA (cytosine-5)-methyltransferase 1
VSLSECLTSLAAPAEDEIIRASGKMAADLEHLPAGTGAKSPGKRESTRPGGHWGYKQGAFIADLRLPARTVTASAQQDWIRDPALGLRRLSPRECAAIQTFPIDWSFEGRRADQYRLVGNAVPPILAKNIGMALFSHIAKDSPAAPQVWEAVQPLPPRLQSAIQYTLSEEKRNGASRRLAGDKAAGQRLTA